jgi:hypothetical protein
MFSSARRSLAAAELEAVVREDFADRDPQRLAEGQHAAVEALACPG